MIAQGVAVQLQILGADLLVNQNVKDFALNYKIKFKHGQSPYFMIYIYTFLLLMIFLTGDFDYAVRACLLYGFLISLQAKRIQRFKFVPILFLITMPSIGLIIASLKYNQSLTIKPFLVWTSFVFIGVLARFLYDRLRMKQINKTALLLSILIIMLSGFFGKTGNGNSAVLILVSFLICGYYIYKIEPRTSLKSFLFLYGPYLIILTIDAFLNNSFYGCILVITVLFLSVALLAILVLISRVQETIKRVFLLLGYLMFIPAVWLGQENYASWIYSTGNPVCSKNHFQFITTSDNKIKESSTKEVSVFLFTSAYCGYCKKEYPYLSELAKKYSTNPNIGFYSAFICFREVDTTYFRNLVKQNFAFEWAMTIESSRVYNEFKMEGVPHLLIIDNRDSVLYNGYCHIRPWRFVNSPEKIINNYMKNKVAAIAKKDRTIDLLIQQHSEKDAK